jgi:hypothetical protein
LPTSYLVRKFAEVAESHFRSAYGAQKRDSSGHPADILEIISDGDPPLALRFQDGDQLMKRPVDSLIVTVRGRKVLLDADLAAIYGVTTKALNQAVKRNLARFPSDLAFRLTRKEVSDLPARSSQVDEIQRVEGSRSQIVTLKRGRNIKYLPYAFTEHGAIMAATVLKSPEAIKMSLFVIRAFVRMREQLTANAQILRRLAEIDHTLLQHDKELSDLWDRLQLLLSPPDDPDDETPQPQIGFHVREKAARYTVKRTRS